MAADFLVTPAGAGTKSGATWANAMGLTEFEAAAEGTAVLGDRFFPRADGTYTLTNAFSTVLDGSTASPIKIIGVASGTTNEPPVFSDWASGDGRPLIACGANTFQLDNNWQVFNLRFTSSNAPCLRSDTSGVWCNCKVTNSGTGLSFDHGGSGGHSYERCDSICTSTGDHFDMAGTTAGFAFGCMTKNGDSGFTAGAGCTLVYCIMTGCNEGVNLSTSQAYRMIGCVFYNCTDGILATSAYATTVMNCIFNDCADGASWSVDASASQRFGYNDWEGNTDDVDFVIKGPNAQALDPQFTDAANENFAIGTNLKGLGWPGTMADELSTGFVDIGAIQREEPAGGGLLVHPGTSGGARG